MLHLMDKHFNLNPLPLNLFLLPTRHTSTILTTTPTTINTDHVSQYVMTTSLVDPINSTSPSPSPSYPKEVPEHNMGEYSLHDTIFNIPSNHKVGKPSSIPLLKGFVIHLGTPHNYSMFVYVVHNNFVFFPH